MFIREIELKNFRNFKDIHIQFQKKTNIFIGDNGQGKTNLAEAISFLSQSKSFRTHDQQALLKKGETKMKLSALIEKQESIHKLSVNVFDGKKEILWNEKKIGSLKTQRNLPTIVFSPESLSVLKAGPSARRDLVDETLLIESEDHQKRLQEFKKILKTKSIVLKRSKTGELSQKQRDDLLMSIQPLFIEKAEELVYARAKTILEIKPYFRETFKKISAAEEVSTSDVDISVEPVKISEKGVQTAEEICNTLRKGLSEFSSQMWQNELNSGLCLYGPHKHDVTFSFDGQNSRNFCSQGQQRTLILAFKLTQILYHRLLYGYYPILILDDVLSELDSNKRGFLLQFLREGEAQTFLTTTDIDSLGGLKKREQEKAGTRIFKIVAGQIEHNQE